MRHFMVIVRDASYRDPRQVLVSAEDLDGLWAKLEAGELLCGDKLEWIKTEGLSDYSLKVYELTSPDPIPFDHLERYAQMRQQQDEQEAAEKQQQAELKQLNELAKKHGYLLSKRSFF